MVFYIFLYNHTKDIDHRNAPPQHSVPAVREPVHVQRRREARQGADALPGILLVLEAEVRHLASTLQLPLQDRWVSYMRSVFNGTLLE